MDFQDYKHTHIPAFGNWDYENGSPITQYFESARQAGLLRYNYGEGDLYSYAGYCEEETDLYMQPTHTVTLAAVPPRRKVILYTLFSSVSNRAGFKVDMPHVTYAKFSQSKTKGADEKIYYEAPHVKEQKRQRKMCDVEQTARQHQQRVGRNDGRAPKAVDEDLYKIAPELLYPKKKKVFGIFARCLVPSCAP